MKLLFLFLMAFPVIAECQQQEIQRALIQRDQQSAEFANKSLETLHTRQLQEASQPLSSHLLPYQRERMKQEREAAPMPAPERKLGSDPDYRPDYRPLPLPGGPRHGVDPIPVPSVSG